MANGDNNIPIDPNNWQTPEQIQAQRSYARLLLENSMQNPAVGRSGPFEAVSPWGGAVMAGQGLMGNLLLNRAGAEDRQRYLAAQQSQADQLIPGYSGQPGYPSQQAANTPPSGGGQVKGSWFGNFKGQNNWVDKQDSGLQASGVPTSVPGIALPNRATLGQLFDVTTPDGRTFTVKQTDLGPAKWTGRGVDINSALAEQMGYNPKNFPTDGKFTVKPHVTAGEQTQLQMGRTQLASNDPGLPTGALSGASPLGGPPAGVVQPADTQMAQAAPAGSPQMAANALRGGPVPGNIPVPSYGEPTPGYFPQRQMVPDRQFMELANPTIPQWIKDYYGGARQQQFQPQVFETPTGRWIQPSGGGPPTFQGNIIEKEVSGPGGMKVPKFFRGTPNGGYEIMAPGQPTGPAGGGSPGTPGPQGAIQGQTQTAANIPPGGGGPGLAPGAAPAAPGVAPTRLASLETGTMTDATPPGMLTTAPPADVGRGEVPNVGPPPKTPKGATPQFAQSMLTQSDRDTFSDMADQAAQANLKTSAATDAGKAATEFSTDLRGKFAFAVDENKKIDVLNSVLDRGDVRSGIASPLILLKRQLVAQFGGDPNNAKDMELAGKFFSDLNLDELKKRLSGFGQIRVFEGQMVSTANASLDYSPAANRALLAYAQAVNNRIIAATNMLNTELEKNNWVPSPAIQAKVQNFFRDKPIMDDATLKKWNGEIRADKQQGPMGTSPPPQLPPGFKPVQ